MVLLYELGSRRMGRRRLESRIQASSGNSSSALPNCQPSANIHPACSRRQRAPATLCGINNLSPIRQPVNPLQHSLGQLFASLHYYFFSLNLLSSLNHVSKFCISGFSLLFSAISALLPHIHEPLEHGAQLLHHVMDQMNFLYLLEYT
jgi:hypothetical protein